jgi:hypothetical protein
MRTLIKRRSVRALLTVVFFALVFAVSVALTPTQPGSCAAPCYEVEHEYYSDATYTTQVGYRYLTCSGGIIGWGTITSYKFSYQGGCCGSCCRP